ncbi:MAG: hypothetical protein JO354_04220 [Verrucomicrobia bacterium]|nr:hypothetical protein [Verrucomicrobiota bacterium]
MRIAPAAVAACCILFSAAYLQAQIAGQPGAGHDPVAAISLDTGESINVASRQGLFGRVAVKTNQAVTIQLQYPPALAGKRIGIQSLDGAQLLGSTNNLAVGADGTARVQVRLGAAEGLYRFSVICQDSQALVRFYAIAPGNAVPDPTLLIPAVAVGTP